MNKNRVRTLNSIKDSKNNGPVMYWMHRDIRFYDNWALVYALELANKLKKPLVIVFCLRPNLSDHFGSERMLNFILKGLAEVEKHAIIKGVGFELILGEPGDEVFKYCISSNVSALVTDHSPLKPYKRWLNKVVDNLTIPAYQVDAHNIIPCWHLSNKQEFAAFTIRPKVHRLLDEFLDEYPAVKSVTKKLKLPPSDWVKIRKKIKINEDIKSTNFIPGSHAAGEVLDDFLTSKLEGYKENRNDPSLDSLSKLSPYLHFGQISAQRIMLEVSKWYVNVDSKAAFIEELVVRRELAENYCMFNSDYDNFAGFPSWSKKTLDDRRNDPREYTYSLVELEQAQTHDPAWNAAQMEMVITGKMHGYMRMYWAKKILEWTESPEQAIEYAIYLNDWYELDGRDPNGYTGIAWSIGGVHDRPWFERPIFGKIRYMNDKGLRRKFDVDAYIAKINTLDS